MVVGDRWHTLGGDITEDLFWWLCCCSNNRHAEKYHKWQGDAADYLNNLEARAQRYEAALREIATAYTHNGETARIAHVALAAEGVPTPRTT